MSKYRFTRGEERANAISHLVGAVLSIAGLVLMIVFSSKYGNAWHIVTTALFGSTMFMVYISSTMAHWAKPGKAKEVFFMLDQISIYYLIAGTYTPIAIVGIGGALGWVIFGLQWGFALTGTFLKLLSKNKYDAGVSIVYVLLYAVMGWMLIGFIGAFVRQLPLMALIWILIGGVAYTLGILFYKKFQFKHAHLVWHILVVIGSVSHFFAVFFYLIPIN